MTVLSKFAPSDLSADVIDTLNALLLPALAPSLRFVTTRGMICNATATNGSSYQTMTRTLVYLPSPVEGFRLLSQQGRMINNSNAEVAVGAALSVRGSLRAAQGMSLIGQFRWGSNLVGSVDPAVLQHSDMLTPANRLRAGWYAIDQHITWNTGVWQYRSDFPKLTGEGFASGATTTDLTGTDGSGSLGGIGNLSVPPLGVLGITSRGSSMIIGDSLEFEGNTGLTGTGAPGDGLGDQGLWARTIGGTEGYCNAGVNSVQAGQFTLANAPMRIAMAEAYASKGLVGLGTNDLLNSVTGAVLLTRLTSIAALFSSPRLFVRTIPPILATTTTGTVALDGSDQVPHASAAEREAANLGIRYGVAGYQGYVDHSAALEMPTNPQKWLPGLNYDTSGVRVHPNVQGGRRAAATAYGRERLRSY